MNKFKFSLNKKDKKARAGLIETSLGEIKTPAFMPVATQGAVKSTPGDGHRFPPTNFRDDGKLPPLETKMSRAARTERMRG